MNIEKKDLTPDIIGEYEIFDHADTPGGMSHVYLARHQKTRQIVAVKIINKHKFPPDDPVHALFEREIEIHKKVSHPNIVQYIGSGEDEHFRYLIIEYLSGSDLNRLIENQEVGTINDAGEIIKAICDALDEIHRCGILHNDISSRNIRVTAEGNIKLMDFGVAQKQSELSLQRELYCKPHFAAPELIKGGLASVQTDVYALGVTFYQMLTGSVPFDGPTPEVIMNYHLAAEIEPPSSHNLLIPKELDDVVLKMMAKTPEERYDAISEVKAALDELADFGDILLKYPKQKKTVTIDKDTQKTVPVQQPDFTELLNKNNSKDTKTDFTGGLEKLLRGKFNLDKTQRVLLYAASGLFVLIFLVASVQVAIYFWDFVLDKNKQENISINKQINTDTRNPQLGANNVSIVELGQSNPNDLKRQFTEALTNGNFVWAKNIASEIILSSKLKDSDPYWVYLELGRKYQELWEKGYNARSKDRYRIKAIDLYQKVVSHSKDRQLIEFAKRRIGLLKH